VFFLGRRAGRKIIAEGRGVPGQQGLRGEQGLRGAPGVRSAGGPQAVRRVLLFSGGVTVGIVFLYYIIFSLLLGMPLDHWAQMIFVLAVLAGCVWSIAGWGIRRASARLRGSHP
jgi:hypothetical protein